MPTPAISIVMSVYNDARFVAGAVESMLAQSFGDFEYLIADDGSTDGTGDILTDLVARDDRIRLFRRSNRGIVASVNFLIEQARAPLIARMDGDDWSAPERLALQHAAMMADPDLGALGTQFRQVDVRGRPLARQVHQPLDDATLRARLEWDQPICNPTAMMRTALVRRLGGYRAAYRSCEDYDFFLRLSRIARLGNLPQCLLDYRRSADQVSVAHNAEQVRGAAVAWLAHARVLGGGVDPTDGLDRLEWGTELDALFGEPGLAAWLDERVAVQRRYAPAALKGPEYDILRQVVARGELASERWRIVARLVRHGAPLRALRMAGTAARARRRDG